MMKFKSKSQDELPTAMDGEYIVCKLLEHRLQMSVNFNLQGSINNFYTGIS